MYTRKRRGGGGEVEYMREKRGKAGQEIVCVCVCVHVCMCVYMCEHMCA